MSTPGTNIVQWGEWGDDAAEEDKGYAEFGSDYLKLKTGTTNLRIIPAPRHLGLKSPFIKTFQHFIQFNRDDADTVAKFNCPKRMAKQRCPACEMWEKLRATKKPADEKKSKIFGSKFRGYAVVIDRDEEDLKFQTWAFGSMVWGQLNEIREDFGDFTHPTTGRDLRVKKKGSEMSTKYTISHHEARTPMVDDAAALAGLIESYPDLRTNLVVPSYEDCCALLKKASDAYKGVKEEDEDDDRKSRQKSRKPRDDDDDEPAPRARKAPKSDDGWGDDDTDAINTTGETVGDNVTDDDDIPF